jgi:hypothetical protein
MVGEGSLAGAEVEGDGAIVSVGIGLDVHAARARAQASSRTRRNNLLVPISPPFLCSSAWEVA